MTEWLEIPIRISRDVGLAREMIEAGVKQGKIEALEAKK